MGRITDFDLAHAVEYGIGIGLGQEIAEELCISDGTVKYHIHNLLKKTNCPNRMKLLSFYAAEQNS